MVEKLYKYTTGNRRETPRHAGPGAIRLTEISMEEGSRPHSTLPILEEVMFDNYHKIMGSGAY